MRRPGCRSSHHRSHGMLAPRPTYPGGRKESAWDRAMIRSQSRALISVDCPWWRDASIRSALNETPLRCHQISEHAMCQACRSLTVVYPFSNASIAEMKNGSVGDACPVLEVCTRLSLKEFGSVLNFLRTASPFYRAPPEDQTVPFTWVFVLSQ